MITKILRRTRMYTIAPFRATELAKKPETIIQLDQYA